MKKLNEKQCWNRIEYRVFDYVFGLWLMQCNKDEKVMIGD